MNILECVGYEQLIIILVTNVTAVLINCPLLRPTSVGKFSTLSSASFTDMIAISRLKYPST